MDSNLKLQIHHENLLKTFTKSSFQNKISKTLQSQQESTPNLTPKIIPTSNEIESLIFQRIHRYDPKKKQKINESLHTHMQKIKRFRTIKSPNTAFSVNDFLDYVKRIPAKVLNDSVNFRDEYKKKVEKLNVLYAENVNKTCPINKTSSHSETKQIIARKALLFNNDHLNKTFGSVSNTDNGSLTKKMADSIPKKHKIVDLEINQISDKFKPEYRIGSKMRAQSAHNEVIVDNVNNLKLDNTQNSNHSHYDFKKRYYRMRDLDKLLANSLTITDKVSHQDIVKNNLLKGVLRNSSNLNYHLDAVFRSIEKGQTQPTKLSEEEMEKIKKVLQRNFSKTKMQKNNNTEKIIENKVKNIQKMLFVDSKVLKYHHSNQRPHSSQGQNIPKKKANLVLRSEIMRKFGIAQISSNHSSLSKKNRRILSDKPMKNMNYVNYFL